MTATTEDQSGPTVADPSSSVADPSGTASEPVPSGPVDPSTPEEKPSGPSGPPPARPRSWWWRYGFPVALVVAVLAIPVLVWAGVRVVLGSNNGRLVATVEDPNAPGWEAVVEPTPTMLVVSRDEEAKLDGLTLLTLTGEGSAGVVQIPSLTVVTLPGKGPTALSTVYADGGIDALRTQVEGILGAGIAEVEEIDPAEWARLVNPMAPLQVTNPDPVSRPNGFGQPEVVFPSGPLKLQASQVWPYLSTTSPGENDLSRMVRREAFWRAWLSAVGSAPDADQAVPGETDSGLGHFVRTLAADQVDYATMPVDRLGIPGSPGAEVYEPQPAGVRDLVTRLVPFPEGPEGRRLRVRVLDGTGSLDHGLGAAVTLAANGGQILKVGNASSFDVGTTRFVYYDDANAEAVRKMRDALGVGEVEKSDEINAGADVTVVLGSDAVGLASTSTPSIVLTPSTSDAASSAGG